MLFLDVHLTHVDLALHTKIGGGGGQGHTVLAGAGLGDQAFLAHVFGEQRLSHAMVELMGAGMVEVFTLQVEKCLRHPGIPRDYANSEPASDVPKMLADVFQFILELSGEGDPVIGRRDLSKWLLQVQGGERPRHIHQTSRFYPDVFSDSDRS